MSPNIHIDRRSFFSLSSMSLGGLALHALQQRDASAREATQPGPHFRPRAKSVIWLMMRGGASHLEGFDPKVALNRYDGMTLGQTPYQESILRSPHFANVREQVANNVIKSDKAKLFRLQVGFQRCGDSGVEVSNWWPHVRQHVDKMSIIRSMWTTDNNHGAQLQFLTGRHLLDGCFPTLGSWIHYGLGSLNENYPQFISMGPRLHSQCFDGLGAHYLGVEHDGVELVVDPNNPLPNSKPARPVSRKVRDIKQRLLEKLNAVSRRQYPNDEKLRARIKSYELAFRMQTAVPKVMKLSEETAATQKLYGLDNSVTRPFGQQLLATRRFIERGVRFVQVFHGGGAAGAWDAHAAIVKNHTSMCAQVDLPIAGLLQDLDQRGLLDETIVVWSTEFGRTPGQQGSNGRDHHNYGFSIWMAGGGIKPGVVHGATDELGFHAVENRHYVTDIHATIFQLLGVDAHKLEVPGRKRLELEYGHKIPAIMQ